MARRNRFIQYLLTWSLVTAASHAHAKPTVSAVIENPFASQAIIDAQFDQWGMTESQKYGIKFALLNERRLSEVDPTTLKGLTGAALFLPNMRFESTEELNTVLNLADRAIFFGQLDSELLTACPDGPHKNGRGRHKYVFIRGTHELNPAVEECYPMLSVQYERVTAIHGIPKRHPVISVNGRLDSKSIEHLYGFKGTLNVHSKRFPDWLEDVIAQGRLRNLSIHGLRSVSAKQATMLSAMRAQVLDLPDITRLSTKEAEALSARKKDGTLLLPSLTDIPPEGIGHLVKNRRHPSWV